MLPLSVICESTSELGRKMNRGFFKLTHYRRLAPVGVLGMGLVSHRA
jgi:hypothetical protein